MRTTQQGDQVLVHYVIRRQDGSQTSSRGRLPLQLTVGTDHPRLPGLGLALMGLVPGMRTTLCIPAAQAFGLSDPARIHRWSRKRFPKNATLEIGKWVRFTDENKRLRKVRILEVNEKMVVVDANHRWAGQALELEVELLAISDPEASDSLAPEPNRSTALAPSAERPTHADPSGKRLPPDPDRAMAFDVDPASLASLREALPGWHIDVVHGATVAALSGNWNPGAVQLIVLGVRSHVTETLGLCRFLAFCSAFSNDSGEETAESVGLSGWLKTGARRVDVPLIVLVPSEQETLIGAALEAGAQSCLKLPITAKEVTRVLGHARAGNQPGRHTANREHSQTKDRWQDDGGQG